MSSSRVRPLILTFDAFGSLFYPRQSIGRQYADAARTYGLTDLTNQHVEASFRKGEERARALMVEPANYGKAFQSSRKDYPIYGKAAGMDPRTWWANVRACIFVSKIMCSPMIPSVMHLRIATSIGTVGILGHPANPWYTLETL